jgi:hypothetical protein
MEQAAEDHYADLHSHTPIKVLTPIGLPEFTWATHDEWICNPKNTPGYFHVDNTRLFHHWDVYVYFWVTSVTWSCEYLLTNALLVLLSHCGAALAYIWNNIYKPAGCPFTVTHPFLPWQFTTTPNTAFCCNYTDIDMTSLVAYTEFLVEVGFLPIHLPCDLELLCDWADLMLSRKSINPYVASHDASTCQAIVEKVHKGKPWIKADENYGHYPIIEFAPLHSHN